MELGSKNDNPTTYPNKYYQSRDRQAAIRRRYLMMEFMNLMMKRVERRDEKKENP